MKKIGLTLIIALLAMPIIAQSKKSMAQITDEVMKVATTQCVNMAASLKDGQTPRTLDKSGKLVTRDIYWWCSGFYPGSMWYIYEYTKDENIKYLAEKYTHILSPLQHVTNDHDLGFQLCSSYGNGYRLTENTSYLDVMYNGAMSLSTRFNPYIGSLKSWDAHIHKGKWEFPVIIDNMMNLELLMWIANRYDNKYLRNVAVTHANTTMRNHFRADYSSYHLVDYDPNSGEVKKKQTVQGFADESRWARGQAWALYGFTMMYRMTGSKAYLRQAQNIAEMLIPLLPADGIPYWDFDSPEIPADLRDASAGAIIASALIELSAYTPGKQKLYLEVAEKQIRTLASPEYLAKSGENGNFILKHGVGHKPMKGEVDVPLTYADYYFLEALVRYSKADK